MHRSDGAERHDAVRAHAQRSGVAAHLLGDRCRSVHIQIEQSRNGHRDDRRDRRAVDRLIDWRRRLDIENDRGEHDEHRHAAGFDRDTDVVHGERDRIGAAGERLGLHDLGELPIQRTEPASRHDARLRRRRSFASR